MTNNRVALLRTVSLFVESPDDVLEELANLMGAVTVPMGRAVFAKGDPGDALYIVVDGKVRVHDGDRTMNFLGRREFFGEMGVLDPNPRSASVTAVEETQLYRLNQDALSSLMNRRPEVAQGIIRVLVQRLRARMREMADDYNYIQQFTKVTSAAAAVEAGMYAPEDLNDVAARTDALGQLARVFQRMVRQVYTREQTLKRQVEELKIEIDKSRQTRQVNEITNTDYFQQLQRRAKELRQHNSAG